MAMTRVWVGALALAMVGCAHQEVKKEETAEVKPEPAKPPPPAAAPAARSCTRDEDCDPAELCIRNQCVPISLGLAECTNVRVHFDFDKSDLKDTDKAGLARIARCLRAESGLNIIIEGNADERGTEEYNLALGDRRANVVEKYLTSLGASDAQLKTISYGFEKPVCTEHNEDCWSKNRRTAVKKK